MAEYYNFTLTIYRITQTTTVSAFYQILEVPTRISIAMTEMGCMRKPILVKIWQRMMMIEAGQVLDKRAGEEVSSMGIPKSRATYQRTKNQKRNFLQQKIQRA